MFVPYKLHHVFERETNMKTFLTLLAICLLIAGFFMLIPKFSEAVDCSLTIFWACIAAGNVLFGIVNLMEGPSTLKILSLCIWSGLMIYKCYELIVPYLY